MEERSARRRQSMVVGRAASHQEAESWDLIFWQSQSPEERLDAYMAIREDIEKVQTARQMDNESKGTDT